MEETIEFIYDFIREFGVNIDDTIPEKPFKFRLMTASPVIKNNILGALDQLVDRGILREENGNFHLTEQGFNEVYGQ